MGPGLLPKKVKAMMGGGIAEATGLVSDQRGQVRQRVERAQEQAG